LIDKLDHYRPLTGYHERIVKRAHHHRLIVTHEVAHLCISTVPIFDHVHLTSIKNPEPHHPLCMAENDLGITTCAAAP
jgi:hypothetical protein